MNPNLVCATDKFIIDKHANKVDKNDQAGIFNMEDYPELAKYKVNIDKVSDEEVEDWVKEFEAALKKCGVNKKN